jgi:hypothetical protein
VCIIYSYSYIHNMFPFISTKQEITLKAVLGVILLIVLL